MIAVNEMCGIGNVSPEDVSVMVTDAQAGNKSALGDLVEIVQRRLKPFICRKMCDLDIASDIMQETLLTLIDKIDAVIDAKAFWGWIYRVATSKIQTYYRKETRVFQMQADYFNDRCRAFSTSTDDSVVNDLINQESASGVFALIMGMEKKYRQVVYMRLIQQLPYSTIAKLTNCSNSYVRTLYHRARLLLISQSV